MSRMVLREVQPKDVLALAERHREQMARDKTRYPFPDLFDENGNQRDNIPLALVLEDGGKILGGIIFEDKGLEMMVLGCSPRLVYALTQDRESILYTLRSMGYRFIRALVTRTVLDRLRKPLKTAGFRRDDTRFASFFREV